MSSDLSHFSSVFPILLESIFMSSSLAVILIDWNHSFLETSLLRLIQSYLPQWRKRNIRQDAYICLFGIALALMYSNSMKNFAINTENCRIAGAAIVVLLSFWLQSKTDVSDKCVGTSKVPVSDKSIVNHKDQETSASTCCRSRVHRFLPFVSPSSGPQSEVNIEEELRSTYVEDFRKQVDEEEITQEELIRAMQYLNTLKGGIEANRSSERLIDAVDHIQRMGQMSRLDDSGLPLDFSYEELRHIVVEEKGYLLEDFERVVEKWLENSSFLPSPEEFAEIHQDMKVQLEREVERKDQEIEEKDREMEETRQEMEEKDREMEEKDREMEEKDREMEETTEALERTLRVVEETTQEVVESQQKNESLRQRLQQNQQALQQNQQALQQRDRSLQQHQEALQQKERIIQQERQRVRMLEERNQQLPEGEWQRRLREMEEEIRRLSTQSDRSKCKICRVEEVQVSFTPCNHLISCQGCADSLPEKICPICRQPVQGTVKVFFA